MTGTDLRAWLAARWCHTTGIAAGKPDYKRASRELGYSVATLKSYGSRDTVPEIVALKVAQYDLACAKLAT